MAKDISKQYVIKEANLGLPYDFLIADNAKVRHISILSSGESGDEDIVVQAVSNKFVADEIVEERALFLVKAANMHFDLVRALEAFIDIQSEKEPTAFNMRFDRACQIARDALLTK